MGIVGAAIDVLRRLWASVVGKAVVSIVAVGYH